MGNAENAQPGTTQTAIFAAEDPEGRDNGAAHTLQGRDKEVANTLQSKNKGKTFKATTNTKGRDVAQNLPEGLVVKSAKKEKGDWAKKANNKMKVIAYLEDGEVSKAGTNAKCDKAKKTVKKAKETTKKGPVKCDQEAAEQSADAGILPPEGVEVEVEGAEKAKLDNAGANAKCDKAKKMANKATTKKGPVKCDQEAAEQSADAGILPPE